MRKLIAALAITVMLLCGAAFAEEVLDLPETELDFESLSQVHFDFSLSDEVSSLAARRKDIVTRNGDTYIVQSGSVRYTLDLQQFPYLLCFTQDMSACFDSYVRVMENADEICQLMIDNEVNILLFDTYTFEEVDIIRIDGDSLSAVTGNLAALSETNQRLFANQIARGATLRNAGNSVWVVANDNLLITVVNSQYILVSIGTIDGSAPNLDDTLDILAHLEIR